MDSDDVSLNHQCANSTSNLIAFQHVGVTAKMSSPLKRALPECSSTETDGGGGHELFHNISATKYNKLSTNDTETTATTPTSSSGRTTESSKLLYEMHTEHDKINRSSHNNKQRPRNTISRVEFKLYNNPKRFRQYNKGRCSGATAAASKKSQIKMPRRRQSDKQAARQHPSLCQRLREAMQRMCATKSAAATATASVTRSPRRAQETIIGIYPFEHGCTDYLHTTDCHPQILSVLLAERATHYATRFWAEFFGSLLIGVSFVVTFVLQTYRFLLYSLVNTLLVGFLHMTSDYLLKPMLTVIFNGFLQPPLTFIHNILNSIRDILEPIAETFNNFMKPIATVGRSVRLVHATYNKRKFVKDV